MKMREMVMIKAELKYEFHKFAANVALLFKV